MNKKIVKTLSIAAVATLVMFFLTGNAFADDTGDTGLARISTNVAAGLGSVVEVISIFAYLGGLAFGVKAALKLKEHNESKGQVPLSQPVITAVVAAFLIALPSLLNVAAETMFGSSATILDKESTLDDIEE